MLHNYGKCHPLNRSFYCKIQFLLTLLNHCFAQVLVEFTIVNANTIARLLLQLNLFTTKVSAAKHVLHVFVLN